ncbi:MAG TPA: thiol-disulfide oxidoreductase DCC family protein [Phycisphaerales bacterium]|nr:thiol-disulfide oxidoreductase DCC family protein [Phycisphaerales bacterium]
MPDQPIIILFDGVCNLCNSSVQWIIRRDRHDTFRFGALQSATGQKLLAQAGASPDLANQLSSMIVINGPRVLTKSDAALAIAANLPAPWKWISLACILPRALRDTIYAFIARNRYRWFGKQQSCMIPTPQLRAKFLDAGDTP